MKRFNSKVDRWLMIVLVASIVIDIAALIAIIFAIRDPLILTLCIVMLLGTAVLIASILVATYYTVDKQTLRIVSGPFRFRVSLDDIHSIKATGNPLSSPALSLDRIMITYGNNRKIMVSPADRRGFLRAIGHELEE